MSNRGLFRDTTTFIRPAGVTTAIEGDRTDICVQPDLYREVYYLYIASRDS
jgi:hypothetical protein